MRYVSLFSGIEAATVAWRPLGWEALAFAEVEPFPCRVLAERFPDVPNLGDVTEVDWSPYRGADVVVGGSPCQAFSVAGNRRGMDDPRGRLMLEFVRAVHDIEPRWFVWENVPGVLSQDGGRAFGTLLGEMDDLGYGLAWRVLDAQFFGVAQRRRRVFLVGGPTAGRACAVLFEPGCVPGGPGASRAQREALARAAGERAQGEGGCMTPGESQDQRIYGAGGAAPTLSSRPKGTGDNTPAILFKTSQYAQNGRIASTEDCAATVGTQVEHAVAFQWHAGATARSIGYCDGQSPTLTDSSAHAPAVAFAQNSRDEVRLVGGDGSVTGAVCAEQGSKQQTYVMTDTQAHTAVERDVCGTVSVHSHKDPPVAAYAMREREGRPGGGKGPLVSEDVTLTLGTSEDQKVFHEGADGWVVRRLTPLECERLQGFPDGHTDMPGARDGPRYKAIGNSMAVPVMRWIGERIEEVEALWER